MEMVKGGKRGRVMNGEKKGGIWVEKGMDKGGGKEGGLWVGKRGRVISEKNGDGYE